MDELVARARAVRQETPRQAREHGSLLLPAYCRWLKPSVHFCARR